MRHDIRIELSLHFRSKWHAGSGESGFAADRLLQRDSRNRPFIPGSTLKGVVRESCERLSRTLGFPEPTDPHNSDLTVQDTFYPLRELESPVDRIFGTKYETGNLFFSDARLKDPPPFKYTMEQSRVSMYRMLGTSREHHLFSTEYASCPGAVEDGPRFETVIEGYHSDLVCLGKGDPPYAYCLLIAGIMNMDRLGGDKSTGAGEIGVVFDSIAYKGNPMAVEDIFDYLDSELYDLTKVDS